MPQRKLFDKKTLNELKKHPLYSQDGKGNKAVAYAKIFNPYGGQTWYLTTPTVKTVGFLGQAYRNRLP